MTKGEISAAYGVDLNTIERFRDIGLVTPKRQEDGTWVYNETDGEMFQRLLLLEKIGFTENDFIGLRSKEKTLKHLLERQMGRLEDGCLGKEICIEILEKGADLESFETKRYLEQLNNRTGENILSYTPSYRNQVFRPWRRYFARRLDYVGYFLIWELFLGFVCHVNLGDEGFALEVLGVIVSAGMMLLIEPLLLNRFGTTFGKWVFGLRVEKADGTHLAYVDGVRRTWSVIGKGEGYEIPIYNWVRLYKSYKLCKEEELQPWDENISYTIKDTKWYRVVACIALNFLLVFIIGILMQIQQLPPNRGDITLAQFAENYNYFCKYLDVNEGIYMDENGRLVQKYSEEDDVFDLQNEEGASINIGALGTISIEYPFEERPSFNYKITNAYLTEVSFVYGVENKEHWTNSEKTERLLIALAFGCTDKEIGLLDGSRENIAANMLQSDTFNFTNGNTRYFSNVEKLGYEGNDFITPIEGEQRAHYKMNFAVTKEKKEIE